MASKNQVTLTFAGDSAKLEQAFSRVGQASETMTKEVGHSTRSMSELSESTDHAATKSSTAYGAFGALGSGLTLIGKDGGTTGKVLMSLGLAFDFMSGVTDLATLALESNTVSRIGNSIATGASAVATGIATAATTAWSAAQWLLNAALDANPIGLVVIGIIALVAVIEVVYHNLGFFKAAWQDVWGFLKSVGAWFSGPFVNFFKGAWNEIKSMGSSALDWFAALPARLGHAVGSVASYLFAPFRAAFNSIASAWNGTVGGLRWSVPSWIPGIGGDSISVPRLPHFHTGGTVPGAPGSEMVAVLQAGEKVIPAGGVGSNNGVTMTVAPGGDSALATFLHGLVREGILQFQMA